jgi:ABC-type transport system involved in cytochrome bd biosynthesis fused ATPase/permease subunit
VKASVRPWETLVAPPSPDARSAPVIELDGVEQTFDGQGGLRRTSLIVADGERLALVGASGSG